MTRSSPGQLSFASGEVSPLLHGRPDYQRVQTGLARCRGFIPLRQGGVTRAPGTWHRGQTRGNARARLLDFEFAANDAVVVELTPLRLRVWRYGALVMAGDAPYEAVTPWAEDDLPRLAWVQSADVIYVADGRKPIHTLSRFALDDWRIAPFQPASGPFGPENLDDARTVTASAVTGVVALSASAPTFSAALVGSLLRLEPETLEGIPLWTGNQDASVGSLVRYDGKVYRLAAGDNTGVNPPIHVEGTETYDGQSGTAWEFLSDGGGVVRITAVASATAATALVLKRLSPVLAARPTARWALGAWSERNGYPAALEIFEQRLVASATPAEPRTLWFSAAGGFDDFAPSTEPDGSFAWTVAGGNSVNRVLWLKAGRRGLHIGAMGEEYATRSENGQAIGPTTTVVGLDSSIGSQAVRPVAPDGKPIFVARGFRRLFELAYAFEADANEPRELSLPAEHIAQRAILELAWQSAPLRLLWCRLGTGELGVMVYDPAEDVLGWATVPLADGVVEAVAVSGNADGSADVLTLVVRRTVAGATVRFVEEQALFYGLVAGGAPARDACHLFAAREFHPEAPTASFDMAHLPGRTVHAWTDKGQFGPLTVPFSGPLVLEEAVSHAIIGLFDDTHEVETLDIQAPARDGLSIGRRKRLHGSSGVVLHRTSGGRISAVEQDFGAASRAGRPVELVPRVVASQDTTPVSGARQVELTTSHATRVALNVRPDGGHPLTLLAIVPRIEEVG